MSWLRTCPHGLLQPPVPGSLTWSCPGLQLRLTVEDIAGEIDWAIHRDHHVLVMHLSGHMSRLETEMDGHGGSCGPPLPGEIWSVPAGRRYASHARGGLIEYAELALPPGQDATGSGELLAVSARRDERLHAIVRELIALVRGGGDTDLMKARAITTSLLQRVRQDFSPAPQASTKPATPPLSARRARLLRQFIYEHLAEPLRLETLCVLAGLNEDQLLAAFRSTFGTTPWQFVIRERLRAAQRLLARGERDITFIALETGFSSHSHLTRLFRRHTGQTPSQFRERHALPV